jgi:hypothetical protein
MASDKAIKDLAAGLYYLAKAVERLAQEQGDSQAEHWARRAKSEGDYHS